MLVLFLQRGKQIVVKKNGKKIGSIVRSNHRGQRRLGFDFSPDYEIYRDNCPDDNSDDAEKTA